MESGETMTLILAKAGLLSKRDQQFVDDLSRREPTPSRLRHLDAVMAAIQRDPRSSMG
jgi:hypothetical protein